MPASKKSKEHSNNDRSEARLRIGNAAAGRLLESARYSALTYPACAPITDASGKRTLRDAVAMAKSKPICVALVRSCGTSQTCSSCLNFTGRLLMSDQQLRSCIQACFACAEECGRCAAACLQGPNASDMARCVRLDLDCAEICQAAASFLARSSELSGVLCQACATVCEACADECAMHSADHCQRCAQACRACAAECRKMAA